MKGDPRGDPAPLTSKKVGDGPSDNLRNMLLKMRKLGKEGFFAKGCLGDWNLNFLPCLSPLNGPLLLANPAFCAKLFKEHSLQHSTLGGLALLRT